MGAQETALHPLAAMETSMDEKVPVASERDSGNDGNPLGIQPARSVVELRRSAHELGFSQEIL